MTPAREAEKLGAAVAGFRAAARTLADPIPGLAALLSVGDRLAPAVPAALRELAVEVFEDIAVPAAGAKRGDGSGGAAKRATGGAVTGLGKSLGTLAEQTQAQSAVARANQAIAAVNAASLMTLPLAGVTPVLIPPIRLPVAAPAGKKKGMSPSAAADPKAPFPGLGAGAAPELAKELRSVAEQVGRSVGRLGIPGSDTRLGDVVERGVAGIAEIAAERKRRADAPLTPPKTLAEGWTLLGRLVEKAADALPGVLVGEQGAPGTLLGDLAGKPRRSEGRTRSRPGGATAPARAEDAEDAVAAPGDVATRTRAELEPPQPPRAEDAPADREARRDAGEALTEIERLLDAVGSSLAEEARRRGVDLT